MLDFASNDSGACPFCGMPYEGMPNRCRFCGMLINEAAEDRKRLIQSERKHLHNRKALSDTFFLIGLLLGGPMITVGGSLQFGLFIVLAAGFASILRRYSDWSTPGTVLIGSLGAMLAASTLVESSADVPEDTMAAEEARAAFASALSAQDPDVLADTRGGGHIAIWFAAPPDVSGECGEYPESKVREHLKQLGFRLVVVTGVSESGGLCSFSP